MAASGVEYITSQLWAFYPPGHPEAFCFTFGSTLFYSFSPSLSASACPLPHPGGRQTDSSPCDQTAHTAFKVLLGNIFHMPDKLPLLKQITLPCLCIISTFVHLSIFYDTFSVLLLSRFMMLYLCPTQGFCIGYRPPLTTRDGFVQATLSQFSRLHGLHREGHSKWVAHKQWDQCWGMLTSWQLNRGWLNKMLCHGAFSCGGVWLMTAQFWSVETHSVIKTKPFGQCGNKEKRGKHSKKKSPVVYSKLKICSLL